jgi:hypothetical protein
LKRSNNHPKTLRFFLETWQLFEGFEVTGTGGSSLILVFPNTRNLELFDSGFSKYPKAVVSNPKPVLVS